MSRLHNFTILVTSSGVYEPDYSFKIRSTIGFNLVLSSSCCAVNLFFFWLRFHYYFSFFVLNVPTANHIKVNVIADLYGLTCFPNDQQFPKLIAKSNFRKIRVKGTFA